MTRPLILAAIIVLAAPRAGAQSAPSPKAPVDAARRTAAAASAATEARQNTGTQQAAAAKSEAAKPAQGTQPGKAAPTLATAPAKGAPAGASPSRPAAESTKPAATPAPTGGAAPARAAAPARSTPAPSTAVAERGGRDEVTFRREVFSYDGAGRRDPFVSLLATGDLRPMLSDLRLVGVAYDPTGRNSIAVMRDVSSDEQYRVKVGQTLGRMRVNQIQPKSVTFTIEEFGYSRREVLVLGDSTSVRTQ